MNILYIDIDSLRPDHLGCHGYHRDTSPNIDALAAEGMRFTNCHTPDAPCLPSRTAMTTGRFGIRTGVVNHGGVASQPHIWGRDRGFACELTARNWACEFQRHGHHTVAFSPFAQRHGAWHWYAGFMEMHNTGGGGMETADDISPQVTEWIARRGDDAPFFLWVNVWDPHTPYRTPEEFGNPFADDPLPAWYTEEVRRAHWDLPGPHSAREVADFVPRPEWMFGNPALIERHPTIPGRQPTEIDSLDEARRLFDGYDCGVAYADRHVGRIIDSLKANGLYDRTAIIVSADHGENLGELHVYGDHQTADSCTHRVPMIVRWPGVTDAYAGRSDDRLLYSLDIAASTLDWSGIEVPPNWDGRPADPAPGAPGRDHLILSQLAWCAQRAARWDRYLLIETYHDGYHDFPRHMLFDLVDDPHEQWDLASERPDLVAHGETLLHAWRVGVRDTATHTVDPLDTVMSEGGPFHVRDEGPAYIERLRATGRAAIAERFATRPHPHGG